ncbi:MAG TPA: sterol desaturase family protein [Pseudolabrys sp.]|nr:sterol desaturase family protein [Pseudolabrys sp.]
MVPTAEIAARIGASFVVFAALVVWELALPRRSLKLGRTPRWPHNLGLLLVDIALVRLLVPTAAVGVAVIAAQRGFGLFNVLSAPGWLAAVLGFVVLDFAIYLQHAIFHHVPALWRLHRVHHADLELDVSTGVRFHPLEILLSLLIKMTVVAVIGVPAVAVLIFEIVLNATSMFNHANVAIPPGVERWLRLLVVTPQMHEVHHSVVRAETDSNFGFNLPWWDRLLGTYRAEPAAGEAGMTIGLPQFRDKRELRIDRLLMQPFRRDGSRQTDR